LLQAAYCDYQIGAFENFHQLVENTLIVLRPRPKIFFQYELRFANCLNGQLLISHPSYPSNKWSPEEETNRASKRKEQEIKSILDKVSVFLNYPINFCFNVEALSVRLQRLPVQHHFRRRHIEGSTGGY